MKYLLFLCSLLFTLTATGQAVTSSPIGLYQSIGNSVQDAKGNVVLTMGKGLWLTRLFKRSVFWEISDNTDVTVQINYQGGSLHDAIVKFNPRIHVWLEGGGGKPGLSGDIGYISYDDSGKSIADWDLHPDNKHGPVNSTDAPMLQKFLGFSKDSKDLFDGHPFNFSTASQLCTGSTESTCKTSRPIIKRVQIFSTATTPGLFISLKDGATLSFSNPTPTRGYHNFVTVNAPTSLRMNNIDYDVESQTVKGIIEDLTVSVRRGQIASGDVNLLLGPSSSMKFQNIRFSNQQSPAEVDARYGTLEGSLSTGSLIALNSGAENATQLSVQSGQLTLVGTRLQITDNGTTSIEVANGSQFNMVLGSSRLGFGPHGVLVLRDGQVSVNLAGTWSSTDKPSIVGTIQTLDVHAGSGHVELNSQTQLNVTDGHVVARPSGVHINSLANPVISGTFDEVNIGIGDNSNFSIPGGMKIATAPGGRLVANDATDPFTIAPNKEIPIGTLILTLPFHSMRNASVATFGLNDGTASLKLIHRLDGSIRGENIELKGRMDIVMDGETHSTDLAITNGTLSLSSIGQTPVWSAYVSFTIPPAVFIKFRAPSAPEYHEEHDVAIFPINIGIAAKNPIRIDNVLISFNGSDIDFAASLPASFSVDIPGGFGEYKDRHNLSAGFKSGNNLDGMQEILLFDCGLGMEKNVSLKPNNYTISGTFQCSLKNGVLDAKLNEAIVPHIDWDDDGCSTIGVGILASIALPVLGTVAVVSLSQFIERTIDTKLNETVHSLANKNWRIKVN